MAAGVVVKELTLSARFREAEELRRVARTRVPTLEHALACTYLLTHVDRYV